MIISESIKDYLKVYENFLDQSLCLESVESIKNFDWQEHTYYDPIGNAFKSYEHELSVFGSSSHTGDKINKKIWDALHRYVVNDMAHLNQWFAGWSGFSYVRFNKYDPTTQMRLHCDHIHSLFEGPRKGIPILTVLGALNDDYEGGEFLMWGEEVKLPAGAIAVFPSNFLYPHEVRPVKSGTRYSYVSWAW